MQIGFVLMRPSVPPGGATRRPEPCEFTAAKSAIFSSRRELGVLAESADVPAVPQRAGRDAERLRLRDELVEQPVRLHLTQSPVRIGRERPRASR